MVGLRLLIATDGSPGALRAVQWIASHCDAQATEVVLVSVVRTPVEIDPPAFTPIPGYSASIDDAVQKEARDSLKASIDSLGDFHPETFVVDGRDVPDALLAFADNHHIDVLVVGRRSHAVSQLMGSVSGRLAHQSPIPVWVIP